MIVIHARIDDGDGLARAGELRELLCDQILTDEMPLLTPGRRKQLASFQTFQVRMIALRHGPSCAIREGVRSPDRNNFKMEKRKSRSRGGATTGRWDCLSDQPLFAETP